MSKEHPQQPKEKPEKPTSQREMAVLNRIKEDKGFKFLETAKIYKAIDDYLKKNNDDYEVKDIVQIFDRIVKANHIPNPEHHQAGVTVGNILDELEPATHICGQDDIYDALYKKYS